jgi:uncharacterized protein (TIGR02145 family)
MKVAPPSSEYNYSNLATAIAPGDYSNTGYFYSPSWDIAFIVGSGATDPNFIPAGWSLPAKEDFDALYDAANATGSDDVLKDPAAYSNDSYGAWGLNFYPAGYTDNSNSTVQRLNIAH